MLWGGMERRWEETGIPKICRVIAFGLLLWDPVDTPQVCRRLACWSIFRVVGPLFCLFLCPGRVQGLQFAAT